MRGRYYPNSGNKETETQANYATHWRSYTTMCWNQDSNACLWGYSHPTTTTTTTSYKYNYHYSYRPFSKQKSEEELKDKNQILEAVNKQLHQKLTETQVRDPLDLCHQPHWVMHVEPQGTAPQTTAVECHRPDLSAWHPHRANWRTWLKRWSCCRSFRTTVWRFWRARASTQVRNSTRSLKEPVCVPLLGWFWAVC